MFYPQCNLEVKFCCIVFSPKAFLHWVIFLYLCFLVLQCSSWWSSEQRIVIKFQWWISWPGKRSIILGSFKLFKQYPLTLLIPIFSDIFIRRKSNWRYPFRGLRSFKMRCIFGSSSKIILYFLLSKTIYLSAMLCKRNSSPYCGFCYLNIQ